MPSLQPRNNTPHLVLELLLFTFLKSMTEKLSQNKLDEFTKLFKKKLDFQSIQTWLQKNFPEYGKIASEQFKQIIKTHLKNN